MKKSTKKGVMINLDLNIQSMLRDLAEKETSSMSQVVRRLIIEEHRRNNTD